MTIQHYSSDTSNSQNITIELGLWLTDDELQETIIEYLEQIDLVTKPKLLTSSNECKDYIQKQLPHLFIFESGHDKHHIEIVAKTARQCGIPLTLIGIIKQETINTTLFSKLGVQLLVDEKSLKFLPFTLKNECISIIRQRELQKSKHEYETLASCYFSRLEEAADPYLIAQHRQLVYGNKLFQELFGYDDNGLISKLSINDIIDDSEQDAILEFVSELEKSGSSARTQLQCKKNSGELFTGNIQAHISSFNGSPCFQFKITNLNSNTKDNYVNTKQTRDSLTGLVNKYYFTTLLKRTLARPVTHQTQAAVIYIELQRYSAIRNSLGVPVSDVQLINIANALHSFFDEHDILCRYSSQTFIGLFVDKTQEQVESTAEAIRKHMQSQSVKIKGKEVPLTSSIGICIPSLLSEIISAELLISRAQLAAEIATNKGANQRHSYNWDTDLPIELERDSVLAEDVVNALNERRFKILFQAIQNLKAPAAPQFEVFVRMLTKNGQELLPEKFLASAQIAGLLPSIDRWIYERVINIISVRLKANTSSRMFVKVSSDTMRDEQFPQWLAELLKKKGVPGSSLAFQIDEALIPGQLQETECFINNLRKLKCLSVIDHAGTDSNSLAYVEHIPFNFVKLTSKLIYNVAESSLNRETVDLFVQFAHQSKKAVIAPYVKDTQTLMTLWRSGVDYVQGYPNTNFENIDLITERILLPTTTNKTKETRAAKI